MTIRIRPNPGPDQKNAKIAIFLACALKRPYHEDILAPRTRKSQKQENRASREPKSGILTVLDTNTTPPPTLVSKNYT